MFSQLVRCHFLLAMVALTLIAGTPGPARGDVIVPLDPRATYLRVNSDPALDAVPIDLLAQGISPGDTITLTRLGDYQRSSFPPFNTDTSMDLIAVFSSSTALGPPSDLNRVLGAIDAGVDVFSFPTFNDNLPTDIPQDFEVSNFDGTVTSVTIQVPTGGQFLFLSPNDTLFFDNSDPNGNFGVRITQVVPEPASFVFLGLGALTVASVAGWRHRRRSRESLRA